MRIADVLRGKGGAVVTINPDATVTELLAGLAEHNIGAMVVVGFPGALAAKAVRQFRVLAKNAISNKTPT